MKGGRLKRRLLQVLLPVAVLCAAFIESKATANAEVISDEELPADFRPQAPTYTIFIEWELGDENGAYQESDPRYQAYRPGDALPKGEDDVWLYAHWISDAETATLQAGSAGIGDAGSAVSWQKGTQEQYEAAKTAGTTINVVGEYPFGPLYEWTDSHTRYRMFGCPVYEWTDPDTKEAYWWSEAKIVYLNEDCSNMFASSDSLESLDLSGFDTSKMTNTGSMFEGCDNLTTIYVGSDWNTDSVTSSDEMFSGCTELPNFDTNYTDKTRAYYGGDGKGYLTCEASPSAAKTNFFLWGAD